MAQNKKTPVAPVVVTRSGRERFLTPEEVAEWLDTSVQTLATWRCVKRYPLPFVRLGRLIRYRESDVLAFCESRLVMPIAAEAR